MSSKVQERVLGICVLYDTFVIVLLFAQLLRFFVKPVFCRYFRKFLVTTPSAEMTKVYTIILLRFQGQDFIFHDFLAQFGEACG